MIPELGSFAIILALCFALLQAVSPLFSKNHQASVTSVWGQFIFLAFAMGCLILSFLNNDITVIYVREHSHALLPLIYKIGAAWGGHEGSLLLWCLILSGWTLLFSLFTANIPEKKTYANILMILGVISTGFILFLVLTSNPFFRDFPDNLVSSDDLTPILQDPGLIFHPPMLYLGYVGFAICFAFAIASLLIGKLEKAWVIAIRPWIILPWAFLSCGIVLGSWWAYRELGWGGWWFWDPVENASLLPWLAATALLHCLIVSEKRESFQGWTILLSIITFALSLLGTFLVRSGVLVSVHAFANDPTRGLFLLGYLAIIISSALVLYAVRIKHFYKAPNFAILSRESFLLINSVILLTAVFTIVIGTLYPIILDALNLEKISVGEPYFNTVFVPIILPFLVLMGFAPHIHWGKHSFKNIIKKLHLPLLLSLFIASIGPKFFGFPFHWLTMLGIFFSVWICISTILYVIKIQNKFELQHWSMIIAHIGIAVLALGVTLNKSYSEERQVKMAPGETVQLANYQFEFVNLLQQMGPNYKSLTAYFDVESPSGAHQNLFAQQRIYLSHEQTLSKPGVLFNPWRDLYLALGAPLDQKNWSVRIYYKPFVRWIWFGGFMLLIGGFISILNYFKKYKISV